MPVKEEGRPADTGRPLKTQPALTDHDQYIGDTDKLAAATGRDPYTETRCYVQRLVGEHGGPAPAAGSPEWAALPDSDPAKLVAVLTAGTRHVLAEQLNAIAMRHAAAKAAAEAVSEARDWARVAHQIREGDQWMRQNPWAARGVA